MGPGPSQLQFGINVIAQRGQRIVIDEKFFRPAEVDLLIGDPTKAKTQLGWEPKVGFVELVEMMVDADVKALES